MLFVLFALFALTYGRRDIKSGSPFQWDNCDNPTGSWTRVLSLSITPNPIHLGSPIVVSTTVGVGSILNNATFTTLALTIETKTLGVWIEIPCYDGIGSCTYTGPFLCGQLSIHADKNCPHLQPYGLPCMCPFNVGSYKTPAGGLTVQTKNPGFSWLTTGDYYVKALITNTAGENACVEVYFSLGRRR